MADETSEAYQAGMALRREMFGEAGADKVVEGASAFSRPLQDIVTDFCFGEVWRRPGLEHKTRSLLTIAILTVLNRGPQLKNHVKGAVANGCTAEEIRETILHCLVYAGVPAGVGATMIAEETLKELGVSVD